MQRVKALARKVAQSPTSTVLLTGESGTGKDLLAKVIHYGSSAGGPAVHEHHVLRAAGNAPRIGVVRPRARRIHGCAAAETRPLRAGRRWHGVSGRSRRDGSDVPGEAAAISRGEGVPTAGRHHGHQSGRPRHRGHEPGSREDRARRQVPRGPVLPPERAADRDARRCASAAATSSCSPSTTSGCSARNSAGPSAGSPPAAEQALLAYSWPGNVRELRNLIERAVFLAESENLEPSDFEIVHTIRQGARTRRASGGIALPEQGLNIEEVETQLVVLALERTRGKSDAGPPRCSGCTAIRSAIESRSSASSQKNIRKCLLRDSPHERGGFPARRLDASLIRSESGQNLPNRGRARLAQRVRSQMS